MSRRRVVPTRHKTTSPISGGQPSRRKQRIAAIVLAAVLSASFLGTMGMSGCVSNAVNSQDTVTEYQRRLADVGPQQRLDIQDANGEEPLGLLIPAETEKGAIPELDITVDPNTNRRIVRLTIEQAITLTLANSPEIRIVSFDPEIARQEVAGQAGAFDPTVFSRINYEDQDSPENSVFEAGQAETRLFESGVQQRTPLGTEWSASYALARIWDDLFSRPLPTRYEPAVIFEFKQPLLRDAWEGVNLAGVNVAKLNYEASVLGFRERAEEVCGAVTTTYWRLVQTRRDMEIQRQLVERTTETLRKVEGRRDIDATDVQIQQAQAYTLSREAMLLELQKRVIDAQDALARLTADPRINTTSELEILPESEPSSPEELPEFAAAADRALAIAMEHNPVVQRARLGVDVAEINVQVAQNQKMPRLDLVGSTRARGLAREHAEANDDIEGTDYVSYAIGLTFEYPLGNRQRQAEWMRRRLERRKAVSTLHSTADQVAVLVKESIRRVRMTMAEIRVQRQAAQAARAHLEALQQTEEIRDRLTPEFLLVKLQAQETYAQARRAEVSALVELNIAVSELARTTGTILDVQMVESSMTSVMEAFPEENGPQESPERRDVLPPLPRSPSF